jgi:hypothetical protein
MERLKLNSQPGHAHNLLDLFRSQRHPEKRNGQVEGTEEASMTVYKDDTYTSEYNRLGIQRFTKTIGLNAVILSYHTKLIFMVSQL